MSFRILAKREIVPNVHEVVIEAPRIARAAKPGQFVILMVRETSERIPYTLSHWDARAGTVTLVVLEMGRSSRDLALLGAGDAVDHVVGPLGTPLPMDPPGRVALAGGCFGIGGIVCIGRALNDSGSRVTTLVEARSHDMHFYEETFREFSAELAITTIDGSRGVRGHAVDELERRLAAGETFDRVIALGCTFMMMLVARLTRSRGIPTQASLDPIMLDGTGMCGACRCTVGGTTRFVCIDGPFFDAHEVDWQELEDRKLAHSRREVESVATTAPVTSRPASPWCPDGQSRVQEGS